MQTPPTVLCYTSLDWAGPGQAHALIGALRGLHPGWRFAAVTDEPELTEATGIEIVRASRAMFMSAACQAQAADIVVHIDPRATITASLDPLLARLEAADILLTARFDTASPDAAGMETLDLHIARTGTFNLGFLAVRTRGSGPEFAAWWADRTDSYPDDFAPEGYADQRWCDLAPALFDRVAILRPAPDSLILPLDRPI